MCKSIVLCRLDYVWVDVVKQFTFAISSPDEFLVDNVNSHSGVAEKTRLKFTSVGPLRLWAPSLPWPLYLHWTRAFSLS